MKNLDTIEKIANDFLSKIHPNTYKSESFLEFKYAQVGNLYQWHNELGRDIRNEYHLWDTDHPLTRHWHMYPDLRNMVNGVDYSEDHPDAVSMEIVRAIHKTIQ